MVKIRKKAKKVEAKAAETKSVDKMIKDSPAHYKNETREYLRKLIKGDTEVGGKE